MVGGNSLGGSSKINAMLYTRGVPGEYNSWATGGRQGWGYNDLLPYFVKSENDLDHNPSDCPDYHGNKGQLNQFSLLRKVNRRLH